MRKDRYDAGVRFGDQVAKDRIAVRIGSDLRMAVVRVDGQLIFNRVPSVLIAARAGFGLAGLADDIVERDVAEGRLKRVLVDWCPPFSGHRIHYPSRLQPSPAFA